MGEILLGDQRKSSIKDRSVQSTNHTWKELCCVTPDVNNFNSRKMSPYNKFNKRQTTETLLGAVAGGAEYTKSRSCWRIPL